MSAHVHDCSPFPRRLGKGLQFDGTPWEVHGRRPASRLRREREHTREERQRYRETGRQGNRETNRESLGDSETE